MSDNKPTQSSRIPFESITDLERWPLPAMGESAQKVAAQKKAQPAKEAREGERIEDVTEPVAHKPLTAEQLNEITEAAEKEGYQAGYEKGLAEGLQQGQQQGEEQGKQQAYEETRATLDDEKTRLQNICAALMEPLERQDEAVENLIVDIAVGLAKHLLQQELATDASALYGVVEQAVKALPMGAANIRVYLNPDDAAMAEDIFTSANREWKLLPDAKLHRGGCRVESAESVVDYSVERRLRSYLDATAHQGDAHGEDPVPVGNFRPLSSAAAPDKPQPPFAKPNDADPASSEPNDE